MREKRYVPICTTFMLCFLIILSHTVLVQASTPDSYEPDNSPSEAMVRIVVELYDPNVTDEGDPHSFHTFFDEDWIKFTGKRNIQYTIKAIEPSAACDPVIELYYMDGTSLLVKKNDFGPGKSESLNWDCLEKGDYYVRFTSNSAHFDSDIGYKITLTTPPPPFGLLGYVKGKVTSGGVGLAGARLTVGGGSGISKPDGSYILSLSEGNHNVSVSKDGYYPSSFQVTVEEEQTVTHNEGLVKIPTPSRPPTISGTPKTSVKANELYSFKPTASDPDGDSIAFSISNKPAWAHFNPDNGMLAGIPTVNDIGIYDAIVITVTDSQGKGASLLPFSLEVKSTAYPGIYLLLNE